MFVYCFHGLVVVVNSVSRVLLVVFEERINPKAKALSRFREPLMLVDHEVKQIDGLDSIIVMAQVTIRRRNFVPACFSRSPDDRFAVIILPKAIICNIINLYSRVKRVFNQDSTRRVSVVHASETFEKQHT